MQASADLYAGYDAVRVDTQAGMMGAAGPTGGALRPPGTGFIPPASAFGGRQRTGT